MKLRLPFRLIAALLAAGAATCGFASETGTTSPGNLGEVMYVGDSITHGVDSASWRWAMHKIFVDNAIEYTEVGCKTGNYSGGLLSGASYGGVGFQNVHSSQAGARAYEIAGRKDSSRFNHTNIKNWLGQSETTNNNHTYTGDTYNPDTFYLLIGTNDLLSDNGIANETGKDNLLGDVGTILDTMFANNANAEVTVLSIPCWTAHNNNNGSTPHESMTSFNSEYQAFIENYQAQQGGNIRYVDINFGMVDVASATPFYGCTSMFRNPGTASGTDGLHPNAQGDLLIAGNVARAQGYAGRTAGQERKAASAFSHHTADFSLPAGASLVDDDTISLSAGGSATLAWTGSALENGLTFEFRLPDGLGDGATGGWNTADALSLTLGDGSFSGTLNITEAYIKWGETILYSMDMSGDSAGGSYTVFDTDDAIRIAYINGNSAKTLDSGFYVWLGDMLIGEACARNDDGFNVVSGVQIQNNTQASVSLGALAFADQSYAPTTAATHFSNGNPLIKSGTSAIEWPDMANATIHTLDSNTLDLTAASPGEVVAIVNTGSNVNHAYINASAHTGDIWVTMTGGGITPASSYSGVNTSNTVTGDIHFCVDKGYTANGSWATWFGALNEGDVTGNLYMEFSSSSFSVGGATFSHVSVAVAGVFDATVAGKVDIVFNDGTFGGNIYAGSINSNKTIGSTELSIHGGTFNGNIYAGGSAGVINGDTSLTLAGDGYLLNSGVGQISAGGSAGTIRGDTALMIQGMDETAGQGLSSFTGILSGSAGATVNGTKYLEFRDSSHSNFGATLNDFDQVQLINSTLKLTSLGGAQTLQIDKDSSLTLGQGSCEGVSLVNSGTLILDGADFSVSAAGNDANVSGTFIVNSGKLALGEGYETYSLFTINGGTLELHKNVIMGGEATIAEGATLALSGTSEITGSLVLKGGLVVDSLAHLDTVGESSYHDQLSPDSGNGYDTALYVLFKGEKNPVWDAANHYITCNGTRYDVENGRYVRIGESDGRYFINSGTVVYGGADNQAASDSTRVLVLNGGNLQLDQALREGVSLSLSSDSTLTIGEGVAMDPACISGQGGGNTLTLAGCGTYDLGGAWELGAGVALGSDWSGDARISGANKANMNFDNLHLSTGHSYIGLDGVAGYFSGGKLTQSSNLLLTNGGKSGSALGLDYALWISNGFSNNVGNYVSDNAGQKVTFTGKIKGEGDILVAKDGTDGPGFYHHEFNGDLSEWTGSYIFAGITSDTAPPGNNSNSQDRKSYVGLKGTGDVAASFNVRGTGSCVNDLTVEIGGASGTRELSGSFGYTGSNVLTINTVGDAVKNFSGEVDVTGVTIAGGAVTFSNKLTSGSLTTGANVNLNGQAEVETLTVNGGTVAFGDNSVVTLNNVTVGGEGHLNFAAGANVTANGTLDTAVDIGTFGKWLSTDSYQQPSAAAISFTGGENFTKTGSGNLVLNGTVQLSDTTIEGGALQIIKDGAAASFGNIHLKGGMFSIYTTNNATAFSTIDLLTVDSDNAELNSTWRGDRLDIRSLELKGNTLLLNADHAGNFNNIYRLDGADAGPGTVHIIQACMQTAVSLAGEETLQQAVLSFTSTSSQNVNNAIAIGAEKVKVAGLSGSGNNNFHLNLISRSDCTSSFTASDNTVRTLEITGDGENTHSFAGTVKNGLNLKMTGAGTQEFTGTVSDFNGSIEMTAGKLAFTNGLATGNMVSMSGGTLQLGGNSSFSSLSGTGGTLTVTPANGTLTLTGEGGTFSGTLQGVTSLTLAETATGTHTLGGALNSLADYTVNGGILAVTGDVSTVNAAAVNKGAKLEFSGTVGRIGKVNIDGGTLSLTAGAGAGTLYLSGEEESTVTGGTVNANVEVQSGASMAVKAADGTSSAVNGNLTVTNGGTLSLDSAGAEAVSVNGLLTLRDGATLKIADVASLKAPVLVATAAMGISLSEDIRIIDANLSGASHLVLTKGSDAVQTASMFSASAREADAQPDTLLATRVANTVTAVEVTGSSVLLTTNLTQSYIDSLVAEGIRSLYLTLGGDLVSTIRREAGGVESVSVSLADLDVTGIETLYLNGDRGFNAAQTGPAANIGGVFHSYDPMQIPEPATATLSLLALAALAARRRRK